MTRANESRKSAAEDTSDRVPSLSRKEALVLELLLESQAKEMYGLEMVATSHDRLKRGTVYVTLGRMEDKGYIRSHQEQPREGASGIPRRLYQVTGYGQKAFEIWQLARELKRVRAAELVGLA
jgi:PadR family transcriptional regulator, regulatory protein PadR